MYISHVEINNFRALQTISVPLNQFSVLIGENDFGKTSFLYALDIYFISKKLNEETDWFKKEIANEIRIVLTFSDIPGDDEFNAFRRTDGSMVISKVFPFDKKPDIKAILNDKSAVNIPPAVLNKWFSSDNFHFIPVRRDLLVQFSMAKQALLGKTLRATMKRTLNEGSASESLVEIQKILTESIDEPKNRLEAYLKEQMHNDSIKLSFDELEVDPIEGVKFVVSLSDDRVENILIQNRGAGTQNNLIIALFRLIAELGVGNHFIFAMEEPENSLHPKAQRQLLSVIQEISDGSQVIVTTHSPVFIDRSKFENNILLTRTSKGNTVARVFNEALRTELLTDLGIRPSDALLKGGGNCAILVEGGTEEDGFPIFLEMLGLSEFKLGIAIINMDGCDPIKVQNIVKLLHAYDIPCVIVLDKNAQQTADDLNRMKDKTLPNIKEIFCLSKGNIEDYYPLDIVAEVINKELNPKKTLTAADFDESKHGKERLDDFKAVMWANECGDPLGYLKKLIGSLGTRLMKEKGMPVDPELEKIFQTIKQIAES